MAIIDTPFGDKLIINHLLVHVRKEDFLLV